MGTPCIRKDFTMDPYMIYEAKVMGAGGSPSDLLPSGYRIRLDRYIRIADSLGLSALVEAHDARGGPAGGGAGAGMIGVSNRNLKDFTVDVNNSERLRALVPDDVLFVAESGIRTPRMSDSPADRGGCVPGRGDTDARQLKDSEDRPEAGREPRGMEEEAPGLREPGPKGSSRKKKELQKKAGAFWDRRKDERDQDQDLRPDAAGGYQGCE